MAEVAGHPGQVRADRHDEDVGTGGEQRRHVSHRAAVHAYGGDARQCRHGTGQEIDRGVRSDREPGIHQLAEPRLVDEDDLRRMRQLGGDRHRDRGHVGANGASRHCERDIVVETRPRERDTEGDRTDELPLDRPLVRGGDDVLHEAPEALEVRRADVGDHGGVDIDRTRVDGEAAVLTRRHAVDAHDRLGDHALGRAAPRQRWDRRDVVLGEREPGRLPGGTMRQRADAGRCPRGERLQSGDPSGQGATGGRRSNVRNSSSVVATVAPSRAPPLSCGPNRQSGRNDPSASDQESRST